MICEACHGEGFVRGRDPENPALVMLPCLECNCSGVASCCDTAGAHPDHPTTRTPRNHCLECGKTIDAGSPVEKGNHRPKPGDIAICLDCAHLHAYADDLTLRQLTGDEIVEIAGDPMIVKAVNAIGHLKKVNALYRDDKFEPELCHHCGKSYRGPALYCSLQCAQNDA
jgi:hypothetical protein